MEFVPYPRVPRKFRVLQLLAGIYEALAYVLPALCIIGGFVVAFSATKATSAENLDLFIRLTIAAFLSWLGPMSISQAIRLAIDIEENQRVQTWIISNAANGGRAMYQPGP